MKNCANNLSEQEKIKATFSYIFKLNKKLIASRSVSLLGKNIFIRLLDHG